MTEQESSERRKSSESASKVVSLSSESESQVESSSFDGPIIMDVLSEDIKIDS